MSIKDSETLQDESFAVANLIGVALSATDPTLLATVIGIGFAFDKTLEELEKQCVLHGDDTPSTVIEAQKAIKRLCGSIITSVADG